MVDELNNIGNNTESKFSADTNEEKSEKERKNIIKKDIRYNNLIFIPFYLFAPFLLGIGMASAGCREENILICRVLYFIFCLMCIYPFVHFASIFLSWLFYFAKKYKVAIFISKLPWLNVFMDAFGFLVYVLYCLLN